MARRRGFTAFNLSFLDVMSCGFGAVILVFLIIDHAVEVETQRVNVDLVSQVNLLEEDVRDGKDGLVRLRNTVSDVDFEMVEARGRANQINDEIDNYKKLIQSLESEGYSEDTTVETLQAEVRRLEEEVAKLRQSSVEASNMGAREFLGDGNRQYLTGLNLGGRNILILLDSSASMLAEELINIIRLRNMSDSIKQSADKWQRSVAALQWLTSQLPQGAKYQLYSFNTEAKPVLTGSEGTWLEVSNQSQLEETVAGLLDLVPSGGTSLENAILAALDMSPLPDNIFLITDGLPTQGAQAPRGTKVNGAARQKLYRQAIKQLPRNVPINIILAPMEGDPMAASEFWQLAQVSKGSFMSPSKDWP